MDAGFPCDKAAFLGAEIKETPCSLNLKVSWKFVKVIIVIVGRVAQSVQRLRYGLDGPGIEYRWGEIFRPSRPALGPTQPPVQWVPGLSRG